MNIAILAARRDRWTACTLDQPAAFDAAVNAFLAG